MVPICQEPLQSWKAGILKWKFQVILCFFHILWGKAGANPISTRYSKDIITRVMYIMYTQVYTDWSKLLKIIENSESECVVFHLTPIAACLITLIGEKMQKMVGILNLKKKNMFHFHSSPMWQDICSDIYMCPDVGFSPTIYCRV